VILDKIVANKRTQLEIEKTVTTIEEVMKASEYTASTIRNFKEALNKNTISIIAEVKKASPSKGIIRENFSPSAIAKVYEEIKIDAISVLTERKFFQGSDNYINVVKNVTSKPVLRKDFIIDEYQLYQAKAIGSDAVLLIVSILGDNLKEFYNKAKEIGIHCLTEVHDRQELYKALEIGCDIIGINNRDLKTFNEDLKTTEKLIKYIPKDIIIVSESGIKSSEDIKYLKNLGVNAVLIGETFMKKIDNINEVQEFVRSAKEI
jgi:indole-3-glycerol phosphate synthase